MCLCQLAKTKKKDKFKREYFEKSALAVRFQNIEKWSSGQRV